MKTAYDLNHVKHVSAIALLKDGKLAGKIIANWNPGRYGNVCTATVHISYNGESYVGTGKNRCGDLIDSVWVALKNAYTNDWNEETKTVEEIPKNLLEVYPLDCGRSVEYSFKKHGFTVHEIL